MPSPRKVTKSAQHELRQFGLGYPGAETKSPWPEHLDLVVAGKTFAFLPTDDQPFSISCKLPTSSAVALMLPFAEPTPYGLGKSGWVSAKLAPGQPVPIEMFKAWIDESYRAQAPKKLIKLLDQGPAAPPLRATPAAAPPASPRARAKRSPSQPKARGRARR
ncbi:MAG: MmcQ/YjbR family DNA-binding protein [Kofleriaceae bacterium]